MDTGEQQPNLIQAEEVVLDSMTLLHSYVMSLCCSAKQVTVLLGRSNVSRTVSSEEEIHQLKMALEALIRHTRFVAQRVGPQHSWWEDILRAEELLK